MSLSGAIRDFFLLPEETEDADGPAPAGEPASDAARPTPDLSSGSGRPTASDAARPTPDLSGGSGTAAASPSALAAPRSQQAGAGGRPDPDAPARAPAPAAHRISETPAGVPPGPADRARTSEATAAGGEGRTVFLPPVPSTPARRVAAMPVPARQPAAPLAVASGLPAAATAAPEGADVSWQCREQATQWRPLQRADAHPETAGAAAAAASTTTVEGPWARPRRRRRSRPAPAAGGGAVPNATALLCRTEDVSVVAGAVAHGLRRLHRAPVAVVVLWRSAARASVPGGPAHWIGPGGLDRQHVGAIASPPPGPSAGTGGASRAARRLAASLVARDLAAHAAGRVVSVELPVQDSQAATAALARTRGAAGDLPLVLVLAGPRDAAGDDALATCDRVLLATGPAASPEVADLAAAGLAARGLPVRSLPVPRGLARPLCARGLLLPAEVRSALLGGRPAAG